LIQNSKTQDEKDFSSEYHLRQEPGLVGAKKLEGTTAARD
jgi:hypothetical protein